jgi:hypothetical protein
MKYLCALAIILLMNGCTTIYFDQDEPVTPDPARTQSNWHHTMVFSLIEVSQPVDLQQKCGDKGWASAKTEQTFLNGLVSSIPYVSWIWTPKTASVQCKS